MERIVIDITSDPSKLQATIDQLEKIGKVDKNNAEQFKKNNSDELSAIEKLKASLRSLEKQRDNADSMEKMMRYQKMIDNQKAAIEKVTAAERARQEQEKKSIGIIENLTKRINQLKEARDKANDPAKITRYNQLIQTAEQRHSALTGQMTNMGNVANGLNGMFGKLGNMIMGYFAIERIMAFGKAVLDTRIEFERFEAQLTTALGSKGAAQDAMIRVKEFASTTPYSVKEITESFVRLANRGIQPTNAQLTKLGDVASALGKPMQSVIEAVLDINNTERWNELGIKVKTNGDKITGTFKGMSVTMDRTEEGALKMIEAFGGIDTVAGGMQRQMETLGGATSNLSDRWDEFLNKLGQDTAPAINGVITLLDTLLVGLSAAASDIKSLFTWDWDAKEQVKRWEMFGKGADFANKMIKQGVKINDDYSGSLSQMNPQIDRAVKYSDSLIESYNKSNKTTKDLQETKQKFQKDIEILTAEYKKGNIASNDYMGAVYVLKEGLNALDKQTNITKKGVSSLSKTKKEYQDILPPLIKKLEDLKLAFRELDASRLKDFDKLNTQRKIEDDKAKNNYDQEISRIKELFKDKKITQDMFQKASTKALEIYEQEKLNIEKKYGYLSEDLARELALKKAEHNKKMIDFQIETLGLELDNEEEQFDLRIKAAEEYYDALILLEQDEQKRQELIAQRNLELGKIIDSENKRKEKLLEDERNEARRHEIAMMEIQEKGEKEILKMKMQYSKEDLDRIREARGEGSDEYQKELNHYLELEAEFNKKSVKNKKEWVKDWVTGINEVLQAMLNALNNMVEAEMDANNIRMDNQKEVLETQRVLASKGLENTLAFEQKRNDELAKQQIDLQRKQQRIKELQIFLNAMAKFAEEDPKSALTKALSLIAATKVAETIFAEEGAIVGTHETKFRGQRHRSGRDRIAIVEEGEVILPKAKALEMGLNSKSKFNQFLKTPFSERIMPVAVSQPDNYDKLAREMKELKEIIRNKQEVSINWDNFDTRIETKIKGSLKEVTKVKKSRI